MVLMPGRRALLITLSLAMLASACTGSDEPSVQSPPSNVPAASSIAASVGSTDLAIGSPQRFEVGIYASEDQGVSLLAFGRISLAFSYLGNGSGSGEPGPNVSATYIGAFGMPQSGPAPTFLDPNDARGVYGAEVQFDRAGTWQVSATGDIPGLGSQPLTAAFSVGKDHSLLAPGDRALRTQNLTMDSKGVPLAAIDSRALDGAPIPDQDLHRWTIADALAQHRPILVLFATPTFCQSRFCGPETDGLEDLAKRFPDRAVFIHVEIWRDFEKSVVNKAAADWVCCDASGDLTEPWLYLIGPDGVIKDRWGPLFDPDEVAKELAELPRMKR
jgi:hypothetical protein